MFPLLVCSVISVAFIVERAIFWLRMSCMSDRALVFRILELAEQGVYEGAYEAGKESRD